ncbi:uncharacterized protein LOC115441380 isoform X1 [Manduca sexta]|uniref:uncharacterized protein LOC115441380 isoform X1 n=1 Tax=Manduca sexta TaxID=7130 RepID=UPI001183AF46|nr:uncharacterized protein LOC115441380 isoform X1 [Manduca sexta]
MGRNRTNGEIKLAWKRMKLAAKAKLSLHRREQSQTGSGKKPPSPSPEDLAVMSIAPHDFAIDVNNYDSDAVITTTLDSVAGTSSATDLAILPVDDIESNNKEKSVIEEIKIKPKKTVNKDKKVSQKKSE